MKQKTWRNTFLNAADEHAKSRKTTAKKSPATKADPALWTVFDQIATLIFDLSKICKKAEGCSCSVVVNLSGLGLPQLQARRED